MELTPEQREQIYLEEKARIEARQQLEAQRETEVLNKNANGVERRGINMLTLIGWTAAICLLIVAFAANHNSVKELHQATEYDAIAAARGFVEDRLKSPGSAKWGDEKALSEGQSHLDSGVALPNCTTWIATGWVDSQNSFGALVRTKYSLKIRYNSLDEKWFLDAVVAF